MVQGIPVGLTHGEREAQLGGTDGAGEVCSALVGANQVVEHPTARSRADPKARAGARAAPTARRPSKGSSSNGGACPRSGRPRSGPAVRRRQARSRHAGRPPRTRLTAGSVTPCGDSEHEVEHRVVWMVVLAALAYDPCRSPSSSRIGLGLGAPARRPAAGASSNPSRSSSREGRRRRPPAGTRQPAQAPARRARVRSARPELKTLQRARRHCGAMATERARGRQRAGQVGVRCRISSRKRCKASAGVLCAD